MTLLVPELCMLWVDGQVLQVAHTLCPSRLVICLLRAAFRGLLNEICLLAIPSALTCVHVCMLGGRVLSGDLASLFLLHEYNLLEFRCVYPCHVLLLGQLLPAVSNVPYTHNIVMSGRIGLEPLT